MNKGNWGLSRLSTIAVCIVLISGSGQFGSAQILPAAPGAKVDLIRIDALTLFGKLEKPPVEFLHDAHTRALAKKNRDCTTCHLSDNDRFSPKFKRLKDTDKLTVMNLYHEACISCHGEMRTAGEKTGPVECNDCHREEARFTSARQPMGFDRSLHFRHAQTQQNDCQRCHHEYNEKEKKLFYAKEKEGTCRYCHRPETKDNIISMRLASHTGCIDCHSKSSAKKIETGPLTCWGCHDPEAQNKIKKISPVPRMERKQPDNVLLKSTQGGTGAEIDKPASMNLVPFDHKGHETYNDTCRGCHHETFKQCNQCHTLAGIKEGKEVPLEKAMHQGNTKKSCMGCHGEEQEKANCAGCHASIVKSRNKEDESCLKCHMTSTIEKEKTIDPEMEKNLAADLLKSRNLMAGVYDDNEIPEKVVIKNLSEEYGAVDFPHRKIVKTLVNNIKDNKLAGYFHSPEGAICKGCHHNSPLSKKPPQCGNCHAATEDVKNPLKPGIKGAYHLQCIRCHNIMKITKVDGCTKCHEEKKKLR
ncbi:MAG: cytochrome c3 family protein [Pseudomonadota bacterium]